MAAHREQPVARFATWLAYALKLNRTDVTR